MKQQILTLKERSVMNYWFVVHSLKAYTQHNNMIGCRTKKSGVHKPWFKQFSDIKKGDKIVYYAGNSLIVGIFEVVSNIIHLQNDPYWKEVMVFKIKPEEKPPDDYYLNLFALLGNKRTRFDLFPMKDRWHTYLQGKPCRELTEHDYSLIEQYLRQPDYLIKKRKYVRHKAKS